MRDLRHCLSRGAHPRRLKMPPHQSHRRAIDGWWHLCPSPPPRSTARSLTQCLCSLLAQQKSQAHHGIRKAISTASSSEKLALFFNARPYLGSTQQRRGLLQSHQLMKPTMKENISGRKPDNASPPPSPSATGAKSRQICR